MQKLVTYFMDAGPCKGEERPAVIVSENRDGEDPEDVLLEGNEVRDVPTDDTPQSAPDQPVAVNEPGGNADGGQEAARKNRRRGKDHQEDPPPANPQPLTVPNEDRDADGGRRIKGTVNLVVFADRDKDNLQEFVVYRANVSRGKEPGNYK